MTSARLLIACAVLLPVAAQAHLVVPEPAALADQRAVFVLALVALASALHLVGASATTWTAAAAAAIIGLMGAKVGHTWLYRSGACSLQVLLHMLFLEAALRHPPGRVRLAGLVASCFALIGAAWFLLVNVIMVDELGWSPELRSVASRVLAPVYEPAAGGALYAALLMIFLWPGRRER